MNYQMTSYREYFRMKTHDERWVKRMMEKYNLSIHYPRCVEYVLRRDVSRVVRWTIYENYPSIYYVK